MYYTIAGLRLDLPDTLIGGHFAEALHAFADLRPGAAELTSAPEMPTYPQPGAAEFATTTETPNYSRCGAAELTFLSGKTDFRLRPGAAIPPLPDYRKLCRFDFADADADCRFGRDAAGWLLEITPRDGTAPARFRLASGSEPGPACFRLASGSEPGPTCFHSTSGPASGSASGPASCSASGSACFHSASGSTCFHSAPGSACFHLASGSEPGPASGSACFHSASGPASGSACFHSASGPAQALTDITPAHNPALLRFGVWTLFNLAALSRGAVAIHASAIRFRERGVLFLGESGTGKSTHTRLWREHISGTVLLNDDSPIIRAADDEARVYGSPWSGKTPCYRNESCPVAAVVRLSQAPHNRIRRLRPIEAIGALLPSAPPAFVRDEELSDALCSVLSRVIAQVPVYRLECRPDADAARLACRTIFNDTTL